MRKYSIVIRLISDPDRPLIGLPTEMDQDAIAWDLNRVSTAMTHGGSFVFINKDGYSSMVRTLDISSITFEACPNAN